MAGKNAFDTIVIIGMGQIGTSMGMRLWSSSQAPKIIGVGRDRANLKIALKKKIRYKNINLFNFVF